MSFVYTALGSHKNTFQKTGHASFEEKKKMKQHWKPNERRKTQKNPQIEWIVRDFGGNEPGNLRENKRKAEKMNKNRARTNELEEAVYFVSKEKPQGDEEKINKGKSDKENEVKKDEEETRKAEGNQRENTVATKNSLLQKLLSNSRKIQESVKNSSEATNNQPKKTSQPKSLIALYSETPTPAGPSSDPSSSVPPLVCYQEDPYLSGYSEPYQRSSPFYPVPFYSQMGFYSCAPPHKMDLIIKGGSKSQGSLFLGDIQAAKDELMLKNMQVTFILTVAGSANLIFQEPITHKLIPAGDHDAFPLKKYFAETFEFIERGLNNGNVLVHCFAGISRSTSIVLAFLMKKNGCSLEGAMGLVKSKRQCVQPNKGFWKQLEEYEKELKKDKETS